MGALSRGAPWDSGVSITPLPEPAKPAFLTALIADAVARGANVVNEEEGGGSLAGALFAPALVFPVDASMRLFHEEQFGPVVPVDTTAPPLWWRKEKNARQKNGTQRGEVRFSLSHERVGGCLWNKR